MSRNPLAIVALCILAALTVTALLASHLGLHDPSVLDPVQRLKKPSPDHWLGTDMLGRDIASRLVHGTRVSLAVAIGSALLSVTIGCFLGLLAGYLRYIDAVLMRIMDALMAIPGILLAIAFSALNRGSLPPLLLVIIAITIPEVPRVVRLVRSVVLSVREEPFVEAAIAVGTPMPLILLRHVMPSTIPSLTVQATYICAAAMIVEAILSFLGAGMPSEISSWGNMIAEGRAVFSVFPLIILAPGAALAVTILSVNILGDAVRDRIDPRLAQRA